MTLLVISPDYASHLLPLASLGTAWRDAGERVVVASGPATAGIVAGFGYESAPLQLGRGSNPGVIRAEKQVAEEGDSLRGFFAATREGMVATLRYQARERLTDLMWNPVAAARATLDIVDRVRPDAILIDHLAYSARLALTVAGIPHGDVVLGHPTALPGPGEVYGFPPSWPRAFAPSAEDLADLRALCQAVDAHFTDEWNRAAQELDAAAPVSESAFSEHGPLVLFNYPAELADPDRPVPPSVHLGAALREEPREPDVEEWIARGEPYVYVSFGSFLSVRDDVLRRVVAALAAIGVRGAVASGSTPPDALGTLPEGWLVREYLPQVRLLAGASAIVTHGGNNSVTEAVASGVPLLVLPFSTDQFAGAAAVERAGVGEALDPNSASVPDVTAALARVLDPATRARVQALASRLRQAPGAARAREALRASATRRAIPSASPATPR
ncbi:nucleotide disphospho-sugar-binding domain-containing protein [Naasia aerilata]|uniref:Glycosyl transferase family 1 n=1 Tax=Naasia aerilata TaxID=1162966 RepID=A0ABN6XPJ2_9MICO|nr:glycosyltransferase [Naasia aerilata]BDZ46917.1 glycosyl transferase family 1 [Naasia aerilata]